MKTANVHQVPQQWPDILQWIAAGETVEVTREREVVARLVPAKAVVSPDFLGRAKAIWGEHPPGKSLSAVIEDSREGQP